MFPNRWRQIESVFEQATELPINERAAYLDVACAADAGLRQEVDTLLNAAGVDFITQAIADASLEFSRFDPLEGQILGPYRIVGLLGEGGMGSVYKAVRDDGRFEQAVAIKIIRPGTAYTGRFLAERNFLAQLQHPFIARLVDGGEHLGSPYLVMELVEGRSIDTYCRDVNPTLRTRLELFLDVCAAVQYAHASLIVHRDLKPSNILVLVDGSPKLLDFGIAKLLDSDSQAAPEATIMLMTPDYASPEQVRGERITVASDVYSLGVVLYEILTGHRPYDTRNQSPGEIERLVCTTGVTAPSANAPTPRLRKQLKGDLDNILLMALRKEPQRRYASVAQFAEDIRRHLNGRTVTARPDTARYRVSKFLGRNRVMAAMAALVFAATAAGFFFTVRQGLIAQRRFAEVRSLANSLLNDVDPELSKIPGTTRARKILVDKSLAYLDGLASEASGDPDLQRELARAYHRAGDIQGSVRGFSLGLYNESLESHLKAVEILEPLYGKATADLALRRSLAALYAHIGDLHLRRGDATRGHQFLEKASAFVDSSDPITFVDVQISLLRTHLIEGHMDQTIAVAKAAIPVAAKLADPSRLINLYAFAAESATLLGRVSQGIAFAKAGLAVGTRPLRREDAMRVASLQYQLGELMSWPLQPNAEMPCEAISILDSAAKAAFAVLQEDESQVNLRVQTMSMYSRLAAAQSLCHKPESIASAQQAIDIYRSSGQQPIASQLVPLAFSHFQLGQADSALQILQPLIATEPSASDLYASILLARGDTATARRLLATARPMRRKIMEKRSFDFYITAYELATNIALALQAQDTTPGLREEGAKLLAEFPIDEGARSLERLRRAFSLR